MYKLRVRRVLLTAVLAGWGGVLCAQEPVPENQTYGSVPQGSASSTAVPLSLADAIHRGLQANLALLTSEQSSREIRAQRLRALSGLLPTVNGQLSMTEQQLNLQALGFLFNFPGFSIPHVVGPYSYQAALANANIPLFNFSAISNFKASREEVKAAVLSIKN